MKTKKEIKSALNKAKREFSKGVRYYDQKHNTLHPSSEVQNVLERVSDLLGFHGVEAYSKEEWFRYPDYSFVNSGDSYGLTLVYSRKRNQYLVTSIGDIIESETN